MKKKSICIMSVLLLIALIVAGFLVVRKYNYNSGKEQGYLIGYFIGCTDRINDNKQDSQVLAGSIAPYEYDDSKWKGFMIGFHSGYSDGYRYGLLII